MRAALYRVLEEQEGFWGVLIQWVVSLAILASTLMFILETVPSYQAYRPLFERMELIFVLLFTAEYLLRLYAQPQRLQWAFTDPFAWIDLLAILPFYLLLILPISSVDTRIVRVLRLVRVLSRILKVGRQNSALGVLIAVVAKTWRELLTCVILAIMVALLTSTGIYYAEYVFVPSGQQANANFSDMGKCLWWAIVTLTTVGYGDMYPLTFSGRVFATIAMVGGVAMIALPSGLIAGAFMEEIREQKRRKRRQHDLGDLESSEASSKDSLDAHEQARHDEETPDPILKMVQGMKRKR